MSCKCISCNQPREGQTDGQVVLDPNEYFQWASVARLVSVDACIAEDIRRLWEAGVLTKGSCCGHNKRNPDVVLDEGVDPRLAIGILGKGWDVLQWQLVNCSKVAEDKSLEAKKEYTRRTRASNYEHSMRLEGIVKKGDTE